MGDSEQTPTMYPQPQMGLPTSQSLELTEYMSKIKPYPLDEQGNPIIDEGNIDEELKQHFNGYLSNDIIWSRLDEKKIRAYKFNFKAARQGFLITKSPNEITEGLIHKLDNLEFRVFSRLDRALDGWERQKMTEMTQQLFTGQVNAPRSSQGGVKGFLGGITSRLFNSGGMQ